MAEAGFNPDLDTVPIVCRDEGGNPVYPDQTLILLEVTNMVNMEEGFRFLLACVDSENPTDEPHTHDVPTSDGRPFVINEWGQIISGQEVN